MANPLIFMFSGQGSQYFQMGRELFDQNPTFRKWMSQMDEFVQKLSGRSILKELYFSERKKSDPFREITYTHPSIFMVEYALTQVLLDLGYRPDYLLGASLGELAALSVAGCISVEDALTLVVKQSDYLAQNYPSGGGMLAVLGPVSLYNTVPELAEHTTLSAINFDNAFVVSGPAAALERAEACLSRQSVAFQRLGVSQAFHSAGIDGMKPFYLGLVESFTYRPIGIPIISCAYCQVVRDVVPSHLWEVIRLPIHFQETIQKQERQGSFNYLDIGPSGTLATFVKYNLRAPSQSKTFQVLTPFGQDSRNLERLLRDLPPKG